MSHTVLDRRHSAQSSPRGDDPATAAAPRLLDSTGAPLTPAVPQFVNADPAFSSPFPWGGTSFDAAGDSPMRSQALVALNSSWEMTMAQIRAMQIKSRCLRNNLGIYRNIIKTWVEFSIGWGLVPIPKSGDSDYDRRAKAYWQRWATKKISDKRRMLNHCGQQTVAAGDMITDGELFRIKLLDLLKRPVRRMYRTEQLGGLFGGTLMGNGWWNGVQYDSENGPVQYEFRKMTPSGIPFYSVAGERFPAGMVQHIVDLERSNQIRGVPWAYAGLNMGMDAIDMHALAVAKDKINTALFQAIETPTGAAPAGMEKNMAAATASAFGLVPQRRSFANQGDFPATGQVGLVYVALDTGYLYRWTGSAYQQTSAARSDQGMRYLNIHGTMIPLFRSGEKMVTHNGGDSINAREMLEFIFGNLSVAFGAPVQLFWNMAGAGGASVRGILELGKRSFERTQRILIDEMCQDDYENVMAQGILAYLYPQDFPGVEPLAPPRGYNGWDAVIWRGPRDFTVDRGREGKMYLELLRAGLMSRQEWWSMLNEDPDEMEGIPTKELIRRREEWLAAGLPEDKFWLKEYGAQGSFTVRDMEAGAGGGNPQQGGGNFGNFTLEEIAEALYDLIKDRAGVRL